MMQPFKEAVILGILVPPGPPNIENDAHGIKKLLLKTQVCEKVLAQ